MRFLKVGAVKGKKNYAYTLTEYRKGSAHTTTSRFAYRTRARALAVGRKRGKEWEEAGWD